MLACQQFTPLHCIRRDGGQVPICDAGVALDQVTPTGLSREQVGCPLWPEEMAKVGAWLQVSILFIYLSPVGSSPLMTDQ